MFRDTLIRDTNILWVPIVDRYTEERGTPPFPTLAPEGYILTAVLRIRDILVLTIQMRKTQESGSETLVYLYHSSKINSHKEVTKQYYIKVLHTIFAG